MKIELIRDFSEIFDAGEKPRVFFAPGRINLIGEHTDYNGGHVFPCSLNMGTYGVVRKRNDAIVRFYSKNFEEAGIVELDLSYLQMLITRESGMLLASCKSLEDINRCLERVHVTQEDVVDLHNLFDMMCSALPEEASWVKYPLGMIFTFAEHGMIIWEGFDILVYGNIPNGSGLSSSSSIDVMMGRMLCTMFNYSVTPECLARLAQYSENNYNGVSCGIMDQFVISCGKKDAALFLDTATLSYEEVPLNLEGISIVIINTNKRRELADSKYNERRSECEQGVSDINAFSATETGCAAASPIKNLCELSVNKFEYYSEKGAFSSDVVKSRAKHAITEDARTIEAVSVLKAGDLPAFGKLMNASHESLRDDYEVTGKELDTIYSVGVSLPGVLGIRMTGAGFGGCSVALVRDEAVDSFIEALGAAYKEAIGYEAAFYIAKSGNGAREI